jgi:SAM domain (Sterile alpha motif)
MDLGGWLRSLGLERYEAAFRDNEIDETVLPNLTAEDLKDLGVGIVGHRRKILDAIIALRVEESAKTPSATVAPKIDTVSTPEQKCISWPEQKYISDAGNKAPRTGAFS